MGEFTYRSEVDSMAAPSMRTSKAGWGLSLEICFTGVVYSVRFLFLYILADNLKGMHSYSTTWSHIQKHSFLNYVFLSSWNVTCFITTYLYVSGWFLLTCSYVLILVQIIFEISEAILKCLIKDDLARP